MGENILSLCTLFEEIEETMARLYEEMAITFAEDKEAATLFARLAREEAGHKLSVQLERRIIKQNPKMYDGRDINAEEARNAVRAAKELKRSLRGISLGEAVTRVVALEESGAEQHCKGVSDQLPPALARLLANLHVGDKAHRQALESFAKKRGFIKLNQVPS